MTKHEKMIRHHNMVAGGLFIIAICHIMVPYVTEYVSLVVSLAWVGDPTTGDD